MSQFLAQIQQDPVHLFLEPVVTVNVQEQLKPKINFQLTSLAESGQLTLLEVSDKYGAMFFAYGPELIVVPNERLNQVLCEGDLQVDNLMSKGSNKTNNKPIAFLAACDDTLFLQHAGDDYLVIADICSVIRDPIKGLREANRCKLDMAGAIDVRQVCISPAADAKLATVVTRNNDNEHTLLLINFDAGCVQKKQPGITSAVFSADGKSIIAGRDSYDENIVVLDLTLSKQNTIKLTFPGLAESIEVDKYRIFWVSEPYKNNYMVFAAYHESQDDFDEKVGKTLMFWVGEELAKPGLTLQQLKDAKKIKACFFDFDHQNDEIIPSFNVEWYDNPRVPNEMLGFAMQNHCDQPFMFKLQNGSLSECYELTKNNQFINRPLDPETGEVMDPTETLGACLGFQMLKTQIAGAPKNLTLTLIEDEGEECLPKPQIMILYSLNGKLQQYQVFLRQWRKDALTVAPRPLAQAQAQAMAPAKAAAPAKVAPVQQMKVEEKKTAVAAPAKPSTSMFAPGVMTKDAKDGAAAAAPAKPTTSLFAPGGMKKAANNGTAANIFTKPTDSSPFQSVSNPFGSISSMTAPPPKQVEQPKSGLPFGSGATLAPPLMPAPKLAEQPKKSLLPFSIGQPAQKPIEQPKAGLPFSGGQSLAPPLQSMQKLADSNNLSKSSSGSIGLAGTQQKPENPLNQKLSDTKPSIFDKGSSIPKPVNPLFGASKPLETAPRMTIQAPMSSGLGMLGQQFQKQGLSSKPAMTTSIMSEHNKAQNPVAQNQAIKMNPVPLMQQAKQPMIQPLAQPKPVFRPNPTQQQQQRPAERQLFGQLSEEQKLAIVHENLFTQLYNEQVVAPMNKVITDFPDKRAILSDIELQRQGFAELLKKSRDDAEQSESIKECLQSTQSYQLAMNVQQQMCDRLKRELAYGILGDQSVSVASPNSDLMKLNQTGREFIKSSGYPEEDKEILFEIFDGGNRIVEEFDKIQAHQRMSEALQNLHQKKVSVLLSHEEKARLQRQNINQTSPFAPPGVGSQPNMQQMTQQERLRQSLLQNAGMSRDTSQASMLSAQAYVTESTKFIKQKLSEAQMNFQKLQARRNTRAPTEVVRMRSKTKYGDVEDTKPQRNVAISEAEMKQSVEVEHATDRKRKMVRNRKRQKQLQQQLIEQVNAPKICKLELAAKPAAQKAEAPKQQTTAYKAFQAHNQKFNTKEADEKEKQLVQMFANDGNRQQEQMERSAFIESLDTMLISSPKPDKKVVTSALRQGADNPKPVQSTLAVPSKDLATAQNSFRSFGSRTSDTLTTQRSQKVATQVSFGEDPKGIGSFKKQPALDQIVESESPERPRRGEKKDTQAPQPGSLFANSTAVKKPLEKQPSMPKLNININLGGDKTKQATTSNGDSLFGRANKSDQNSASVNSSKDKPSQPLAGQTPKEDSKVADKAAPKSLFGQALKEDPKPAKSSLFGQSMAKPEDAKKVDASNSLDSVKKPEVKSAFGSGAFVAPTLAKPQPMGSSIFASAQQQKAPSTFGTVDIGAKAKPADQKPFGGAAFGATSTGQAASGGFLSFAKQPAPSTGQVQPMGFMQQPAANGGMFSSQQPQGAMPQVQSFQGFGGAQSQGGPTTQPQQPAGMFGGAPPTQPQQPGGGMFGGGAPTQGGFGAPAQPFQGFSGGGGGFGAPAMAGGFGAPAMAGGFGAPAMAGGFGAPAMGGGFGAPAMAGGQKAPSQGMLKMRK